MWPQEKASPVGSLECLSFCHLFPMTNKTKASYHTECLVVTKIKRALISLTPLPVLGHSGSLRAHIGQKTLLCLDSNYLHNIVFSPNPNNRRCSKLAFSSWDVRENIMLYFCPPIYSSIHLFINLYIISPFINPVIHLFNYHLSTQYSSMHSSIHLTTYPRIFPCIHFSSHVPIHPFTHPSIDSYFPLCLPSSHLLFICLPIHPPMNP